MTHIFLGVSEYSKRFTGFDRTVYINEKNSHSINKDLLENHRLRVKKLQKPEKYAQCTGNSEQRIKFKGYNENEYRKQKVTGDEFKSINEKGTFFSGATEYCERYKELKVERRVKPVQETALSINPILDLEIASDGRSYEKNNSVEKNTLMSNYNTQYNRSHQWPALENRERHDWMKANPARNY